MRLDLLKAGILLTLLLAPREVQAQTAQPTDVSELVSLFETLCIRDFPDEKRVEADLASNAATPMTAADVQRYLHNDPGRAWYLKTTVALYAVTLEQPPFHTCAVRRMTPLGAESPAMGRVARSTNAYATSIGGTTTVMKANNTRLGPNGPDVLSFGLGVSDAAGKPSDTFGVFLTNYHGRVPEPWVADATPGIGVEVRFSRQVLGR